MIKDLDNIVHGTTVRASDTAEQIPVHALFDESAVVGRMPDLEQFDFLKAVGFSKREAARWDAMPLQDRLEVMANAGRTLRDDTASDTYVALAGGNPIQFVRREREGIADWLRNYGEYLRLVFSASAVDEGSFRGVGVVASTASSTSYATQPFVIIEALGAGNSVIAKLDSTEPFSAAQAAEHLARAGAPIQTVSFDYRKDSKSDWGHRLYENSAKMPVMGYAETIAKIAHPSVLAGLERRLQAAGLDAPAIAQIIEETSPDLPVPSKVVPLTIHGGLGYVGKSADMESAIRVILESSAYQIRTCKRMRELIVHPDAYDTFLPALEDAYRALKVGDVLDAATQVPAVSTGFWEANVEPYLKIASGEGSAREGGGMNQPTILLDPSEAVTTMECNYAVVSVRKGTMEDSFERMRKMSAGNPYGRILEFSSMTQDPTELAEARNAPAFNIHRNEPTTVAIGRPHEGLYLVQALSSVQGVNR